MAPTAKAGNGNGNNTNGGNVPAEIDPTGVFGAFIKRLERTTAGPSNQTFNGDRLLKEFRALRPEKFDGMGEPWKAEEWLREMERIFDTMGCDGIEKRRLATFQLSRMAATWWDSVKATLGEEAISMVAWGDFKERFLGKYFSENDRENKEVEFINLKQDNKTVREYTV